MSDLRFDELRWLHLLWAVLAVALAGGWGLWQRHRALRRFAAAELLPRLAPGVGRSRAAVRPALHVTALVLLTAALIGPRWGQELRPVVRRNVELLVLLDVSRSMLARDLAPNRLERAKLSIAEDLLPVLAGDQVGLMTFAGDAVLACPLTIDYGSFRLALQDVSIRSAGRGGTNIGDALRKAADVLRGPPDRGETPRPSSHRLVLLVTDGEDHASFPVEAAAALWQDLRVPVIAVALGDPQGARIPVPGERGETYLQHAGQDVVSKADFATLRAVAAASPQGLFVPVGTQNFDLGEIYRRVVRRVRAEEDASQQYARQPARAHVFILAALAVLLVDALLRDGPRRVRSRAAAAAREKAA